MKTTFLLLTCLMQFALFGQGCTIDYNQTMVGIYPSSLPTATQGQPFSTDVTFVLPTDTLGYPFTNFQIVSINLPLGLNWSCSQTANNCNYNPQMDVYGCIQIFGTPLLTGTFQVEIMILADLTILQGYPYQFNIELTVNQASLTNNIGAFSYQIDQPCAPAIVNFYNQEPGLTFYSWDFGNGNYSNAENPNAQFYPTAGNYPISYSAYASIDTNTLISLVQLNLQTLSNYGENFPSFEEADPYFKIKKNGLIVYQSNVFIDQNPPLAWWPNLNLELGQDYIIEVWEADQSIGENYFGADDYIGNHTLNVGSCNGCFAGTAQISYQISMQNINPSPSFLQMDTITLYPSPDVPLLSYDSSAQQLLISNQSLFTQWYQNGQALLGQNNNTFDVQTPAYYHAITFNASGCSQSSDTLFISIDFADLAITDTTATIFQLTINQFTKQLVIELDPQLVGAQLELWLIDGSLVQKWTSDQTTENYPIDLLSNGIYLVKLSKGNVVKERKIAIVH